VSEQRNILHEIRKRKANWIGHILRRNCLLKEVIGGKIEEGMDVMERQGIRRKQILDLKEITGCWKLKEEAPDRTVWRTGSGRGCGTVLRQTAECMNE
jgi:hypothetical protein